MRNPCHLTSPVRNGQASLTEPSPAYMLTAATFISLSSRCHYPSAFAASAKAPRAGRRPRRHPRRCGSGAPAAQANGGTRRANTGSPGRSVQRTSTRVAPTPERAVGDRENALALADRQPGLGGRRAAPEPHDTLRHRTRPERRHRNRDDTGADAGISVGEVRRSVTGAVMVGHQNGHARSPVVSSRHSTPTPGASQTAPSVSVNVSRVSEASIDYDSSSPISLQRGRPSESGASTAFALWDGPSRAGHAKQWGSPRAGRAAPGRSPPRPGRR
jgi:hypothetical protein